MSQNLLQIRNLKVSAANSDKIILEDVTLSIPKGETHVLMGQNGAGKSTLGATIMGSPAFTVEQGEIDFNGKDITHESVDARAKDGIFLSFQTPEEVPGITLESFLRVAQGAVTGEPARILPFRKKLSTEMEELQMSPDYAKRDLNVGFSGGERKKSEVLQMLTLNPKLAILDETDSGLDVDAVRTVARGIRQFRNEENSLLIITHNAKMLEGMQVDKVHILAGGKIVHSGDASLVDLIIEKGFCAVVDDNGKCVLSDEDGACCIGDTCPSTTGGVE